MTAFALTLEEAGITDRDSYLDSGFPTTNFGSDSLIKVGKHLNFSTRHFRGVLGRNVSGDFPVGAIIDTCGLLLEVVSLAGNGPNDSTWSKVIDPWNWFEDDVSYNMRNSLFAWLAAGGDIELVSPAPVAWLIPGAAGPRTFWGLQFIMQDAIDVEGGKFAVIGKKDLETTGFARQVSFLSSLDPNNPPQIVGTYHVPIVVGYNLYLKNGTPPNPAVDQPVATVDSSAISAVLDMAALGLAPDADYLGVVSPFNTVGRAPSSAPFGFRTDGAGLPLIIPAPVSRLTAVPLVGGDVRVSWTYDEPNPIAVADTFEIEVFNDTSSFPFSVPHAAPKRTYARALTIGGDGLFHVSVHSAKGGLSQANVSPVAVMLDATPPAVVPVAMSAV